MVRCSGSPAAGPPKRGDRRRPRGPADGAEVVAPRGIASWAPWAELHSLRDSTTRWPGIRLRPRRLRRANLRIGIDIGEATGHSRREELPSGKCDSACHGGRGRLLAPHSLSGRRIRWRFSRLPDCGTVTGACDAESAARVLPGHGITRPLQLATERAHSHGEGGPRVCLGSAWTRLCPGTWDSSVAGTLHGYRFGDAGHVGLFRTDRMGSRLSAPACVSPGWSRSGRTGCVRTLAGGTRALVDVDPGLPGLDRRSDPGIGICGARAHRGRTGLGRVGTAIIVVGLVVVPWLHIKNLAPLAVAMASLVIIGRRSRVASGRLVAMSTVVLASVGGLFFYNWFYFGRIGGLPLSGLSLAPETAWRSLALLMDRHQGLVVQVPTVLLGLVGLAIAGSRSWRSAVATTLGAATVLVINASYAAAPFGGSVFAGRFQWTIAPMLLAWAAVTIGRIQVHRGRLFVLGTAITALWTAQLIPILEAHHEYFNAAILPFRPWDPSLYPGWWGVLDRLLPTFVYPRGSTRDWVGGDLLALTVVIVTVLVILRLCSPRPFGLRPVGLIVAGTAVVAGVLVVASHAEPAPAVALVWTGRDLSSPWVTGERAVQYRPVPLVDVGPGSYVATFSYRSEGRAIRPPIASINLTPVPVVAVSHWLVWSDPTDARLIHI